MKRRVALLAVTAFLLVPACGGGGGSANGAPNCSPNGTALNVIAKISRYDTGCLAAPADTAFTIQFENQDAGVPHNVAIVDQQHGNKPLFRGKIITGPTSASYAVGALPAGTYLFRCEIHPDSMSGTFVVKYPLLPEAGSGAKGPG